MSKNNAINQKRSEPKVLSPELREWMQAIEQAWLDAWQVDPAQYGLTTLVVWSVRPLIQNSYGFYRKDSEEKRWEALWLGWSESTGLVHQLKAYSRIEDAKPQPNFWWTSDIDWHIRLVDQERWRVPTISFELDNADQEKRSRIGNLFVKFAAEQKQKFSQNIPEQALEAFNVYSKINQIRKEDSWRYLDRLQTILGENPQGDLTIAEASKRRTQFIQTHPVLGTDYIFRRMQSLAPIDEGERSLPLLATSYGISERTVRFLANLEAPAQAPVHNLVIFNLSVWEGALNGLTNEGLEELRSMHRTGWAFLNEVLLLPVFKRAPQLVKNLCFEPGVGGKNINDFANTRVLAHLMDTARNFALEILFPYSALVYPEMNQNRSYNEYTALIEFAEEAFFCKGLNSAIDLLTEHLRNEVHHARMGAREKDEKQWDELGPPVQAPNGLTMRFLNSQQDLNWEGQQMQHCVASYGKSCASRTCAIMSIGEWVEDEWHPISTAEIKSRGNSAKAPVLYCNQHYGKRNNSAPAQSNQALEWWLKQVANGDIIISKNRLVIDAGHTSDTITPTNLTYHLGDGWSEPGAFAYRWDRWRRLLNTGADSAAEWLHSIKPLMAENSLNARVLQTVDLVIKKENAIEGSSIGMATP